MASKRVIVCGNWKMNLGPAEGSALAKEVTCLAHSTTRTEVWVAPPALSIPAVAECLRSSKVALGGQNVHWEKSGAFTGEISVPMLKETGAAFAIVGHSERRHLLLETSDIVAQRTIGGLAQQFGIILCVGETLAEREGGRTEQVLAEQLNPVLAKFGSLGAAEQSLLIIAYEPVWAIGTGKVATIEQIAETHRAIQTLWSKGSATACPPILYGGSVKPDNFAEIIALPAVNGALVGGASLKADQFKALVEIAEKRD